MPVNVEKMAAKYQTLQSMNGDVPYFEFEEGLNIIRILPPPPGKDDFFLEITKCYNVGPNNKTIVPRTQFGLPCPLQDHLDQLYKMGDEVSRKEADKMKPKRRVYIPIIVRNSATPNVPMLLDINTNVFKDILAYFADPSYGDITHFETGTDLKITYTDKKKTNNGFPDWAVMAARERSRLSDDPGVLQSLCSTDWLEAWKVNRPSDADYIVACLQGKEKAFNEAKAAATQQPGQQAAPAAQPGAPPVQQPQTPVNQGRRFWVSDMGTVVDIMESDLRARYTDAGKSGYPVMLHGEQVWKDQSAYGLFPTVNPNAATQYAAPPAQPAAPQAPASPQVQQPPQQFQQPVQQAPQAVYQPPVQQPMQPAAPQAVHPVYASPPGVVPAHPAPQQPPFQMPFAPPAVNPMEAAFAAQLQGAAPAGPPGFPGAPPAMPFQPTGQSPVGQELRNLLK